MDRKKLAALLFSSALTFASASGFALNSRTQPPYPYQQTQQTAQRTSQDRALRAAIKAKRAEVKRLQKAHDPRAAQAQRELDALNSQWHATRGNGNGKGNGRWKNSDGTYVNPNGTVYQDNDDNRGHRGQGKAHGRGHEKD